MIGRRKYESLKGLAKTLTNEDRKNVKEYEDSRRLVPTEKTTTYFKNLRQKPKSAKDYVVKYDILLEKFLLKYEEREGVPFNLERLPEIKAILYYFAKDERFFNAPNLTDLSKPSFDKGLLIIGSYGTGKTSTMKALKELFSNTPLSYKVYSAKMVVSTFEGQGDAYERGCYIERCKTGTAYFDDVKAEKTASNFGLFNLMREILDRRSEIESKTFITCNYEEGTGTDLQKGIDEFITKYGERVHDRLFKMFNIIEVKGKSLRR